MPRIFFKNTERHLMVGHGANLMQALLENQVPVASSCGGDGVCTKCQVNILENPEHLSPVTPAERKMLSAEQIDENVRLSCQVSVRGDTRVHTDYW
jgi:2Fe-2S ferredoxin